MRKVFAFVCFLVVYGSLYPFNFNFSLPSLSTALPLAHFNFLEAGFTDGISNIILFIPIGFLLTQGWNFSTKRRLLFWCIFTSFSFGYFVQVLQLWAVGRVPWGGDAVLNTIGAIVGSAIALRFKPVHLMDPEKVNLQSKVFAILGTGLLVIKLAPYAPSMDFGILKENVKNLIYSPSIDVYWLFEHTVTWVLVFFFLACANPLFSRVRYLISLAICVLALKFFIIANDINLSQLLGAALALFIFIALKTRINKVALAGVLLVAVVLNGYYPFELRTQIASFEWIPFTGALNGNILLNILATSKKLLLYSSAILLLHTSIIRLKTSTTIVAVVVLVSEIGQVFVTNSVPESTDFILVLISGYLLKNLVTPQSMVPLIKSSANSIANLNSQSLERGLPARGTIENNSYIRGLDGLRAFAALAVFIVHFQQFTQVELSFGPVDFTRWMINGNTGVALFFALSGFLLAIPFCKALERREFPNTLQYLKHRAVRIIPLYYLCFFGLLMIKGFSGPEVSFNNITSHLFFVHNLKDSQVMSLNPPFWTLAVEMQFYLILPLVFLAMRQLKYHLAQFALIAFIVVWFLGYKLIFEWMSSNFDWPLTFSLVWPFGVNAASATSPVMTYSLASHLPHFLLGTLFASQFIKRKLHVDKLLYDVLILLIVISTFIILATPLDESFQLEFGRYNFPYVPVLLSALIFFVPSSKVTSNLLEFKFLKWLGVVSYGIYIFHYPLQKALKIILEKFGVSVSEQWLLFGLLSLGATIILASLSYRFIEQPIISYFRNIKVQTVPEAGNDLGDSSFDEKGSHENAKHDRTWYFSSISKMTTVILVLTSALIIWLLPDGKTQVTQPYWAGLNRQVIFDHHAHTDYSDGALTVAELVELSYFNGCDAMAVTDHSGYGRGVSRTKLDEISMLREKFEGLLIFSGIEIGVPSYNDREHVNLIVSPEHESYLLPKLSEILKRDNQGDDGAFINVIKSYFSGADKENDYITVYNHPSRKDESLNENVDDFRELTNKGLSLTAFSGAPGHQRNSAVGSYKALFKTKDRWDPFVADIGGGWDTLLASGERVWGAVSSSDFHNEGLDYPPCSFSRIHLEVPDKSYDGVISAFQHGTFWADHGGLLFDYEFNVEVGEEKTLAYSGATIELVSKDEVMLVNVAVTRAEKYKDDFLRVDLISNCTGGEVTAIEKVLPPEDSIFQLLMSKSDSVEKCFIRSRVILEGLDEHKLSAYSNPIFIQ
jgi:peptidoglycan/LPS O-acetylase OafA/YrhL/VanZ family protein